MRTTRAEQLRDSGLSKSIASSRKDHDHLALATLPPSTGRTLNRPIPSDEFSSFDAPLRQILRLMHEKAQSYGPENVAQALVSRLSILLRSFSDKRSKTISKLPTRIIRRVIDRIQADPVARLDLESLAAETGYSKSHFLRAFRASTGTTPHKYVIHLRLERACQLMNNQALTLLEIALESGFASDAHLSRAFRHRFGVCPSEFRRKL